MRRCLAVLLALVACGAFIAAGAETAGETGHVLDGECFSLYHEAADAMEDIYQRESASLLAGTYRYEGGGFGGEFTITLNADGTYTFYEGPLSSYMGMGTWYAASDAVYMSEGDAGYDLSFTFRVEEDALTYLARGSDAFLYVELPDGARFVRLNEEDDR